MLDKGLWRATHKAYLLGWLHLQDSFQEQLRTDLGANCNTTMNIIVKVTLPYQIQLKNGRCWNLRLSTADKM